MQFRRMCEQGILTAEELESVNLMQVNLEKLKLIKTRIIAEDTRIFSDEVDAADLGT